MKRPGGIAVRIALLSIFVMAVGIGVVAIGALVVAQTGIPGATDLAASSDGHFL